jgi:uncharacterized protein (TIGR04255 family)
MSKGARYWNPPVALVALELRHPSAGRMTSAAQNRLKRHLRDYLPLLKLGEFTTVQAIAGKEPDVSVEKFPKYLNRNFTAAASVRDTSIIVETTRHSEWEDLRDLFAVVLRARRQVGDIDGIERLGLRYINEVRVPELDGQDWSQWISGNLLGQADVGRKLELEPLQWQGVTVFGRGDSRFVTLRHGPGEGYAVNPGGDLKRPTPTPGPYFLIDIDSFWASEGEVPEVDFDRVLMMADDLHEPAGSLFESLITPRLRKDVLNRRESA